MENQLSPIKLTILIFCIFVFCFSVVALPVIAWNTPISAPPNDNVAAPINVGGVGQVKVSGLILNCGTNSNCSTSAGTAANGLLVPYGNVGIGTATPNKLLHVNQNVSGAAYVKFQNQAGTGNDSGIILSTSTSLTADNVGSKILSDRTDAGGAGSSDLVFSTSSVTTMNERMRILANGNVGIGTNIPSQKLDVVGVINIQGTTGGLRLDSRDLSGVGWVIYNPTGDDIRFYDGADRITFKNGGSVGIGTVSPGTNRLEIAGGTTKTTGGLIIETRTSDPSSPETGRLWLRTDINP